MVANFEELSVYNVLWPFESAELLDWYSVAHQKKMNRWKNITSLQVLQCSFAFQEQFYLGSDFVLQKQLEKLPITPWLARISEQKKLIEHPELGTFTYLPATCTITSCLCRSPRAFCSWPCPQPLYPPCQMLLFSASSSSSGKPSLKLKSLCHLWDFPGSPVVKIWRFQCKGLRFDPWLGN